MRFGPKPVALLDALTPPQFSELRAIGNMATYRKNATIYELGQEGSSLYLVVQGRVRLRDRDQAGQAITVGFAAAGEAFGLEPLTGARTRALSATAAEKSEVLALQGVRLREVLLRDPALSLQLLQHLAAREEHAAERIKMLAFLDVPSRLAGTLLWLADGYGVSVEGGTEIPHWFTHQELADLIGSTRETVTTVLAEFRRAGLLTSRDHHFVILDATELRRRVGDPTFGRASA